MRIALKVGPLTYYLAGQYGVSEREHSSTANFRLDPQIQVQPIMRVRAAAAYEKDRGNLLHRLTFSTSRKFATPAAAEYWLLRYDAVTPREGVVRMESIAPPDHYELHELANALVYPPARSIIGCSVQLDYTITGGALTYIGTFLEIPANALRGEDGEPILDEDGNYILTED
jgi:hypothetical protein